MSRSRIPSCLAVALALTVSSCGGGDDPEREAGQKPVEGTFVGKLKGGDALVAIVASPASGKQGKQELSVYVSDGKKLSEWFPGSVQDNRFTAKSADGDAELKGKLSASKVTGTVELEDGKAVGYAAAPATGAAGLYDLSVSAKGKLTGASAAGIGLKGQTPLSRGTGTIKLADGKKMKFVVTRDRDGNAHRLRSGQLLMIVLGGGELSGAGKGRDDGGDPAFFVRSS